MAESPLSRDTSESSPKVLPYQRPFNFLHPTGAYREPPLAGLSSQPHWKHLVFGPLLLLLGAAIILFLILLLVAAFLAGVRWFLVP
jgi:hypothetical protein